jgi:UDP-2,3-diacylglucosamine pyrophosphatase LpxH
MAMITIFIIGSSFIKLRTRNESRRYGTWNDNQFVFLIAHGDNIAVNSIEYHLPEKLVAEPRITASLVALEDALARLDERARTSPLTEGWMQRLVYHEACATQLAEGDLVHLDDLILFDHGLHGAEPSSPLSRAWHTLGVWRRALRADAAELLRLPRPGEVTATPAVAPVEDQAEDVPAIRILGMDADNRLARWRRILSQTRDLPPTMAAVIAMDAWSVIAPEERGAWRAPMLGALVLRQRGKTRAFLLPIDYGRRFATYRRHDNHSLLARIEGTLEWMRVAADRAEKDLQRLALADGLIRRHLEGRRRTSRLKDLADLFLLSPVVTVGMAAKALGVSRQAVDAMIPELGSAPRELTGNGRNRAWMVG